MTPELAAEKAADIPADALDWAVNYDYANRGAPDGGGWRRVYPNQIRRLLAGLIQQGYTISPPPKPGRDPASSIVINVQPNR